MKFDHINIGAPMPLLEQVRDFYCAVFDLESGFRPAFTRRGFWLYKGDQALIHLVESSQHNAAEKQGYFDHIAFRLSGLDGFIERLEAGNITYRRSYISESDLTQLFFKDPAGTGIEANFAGERLPA